MGWFKVDDQLAFHSKVMMAGNSAMGLWVRAGSWSAAQLTGGFLPTHMANAMANMANGMANGCDTDALVMAGLWQEVEGGYQFHDWDLFQPDAEAEKAKREELAKARSDAGKAGAKARWANKDDGKPHGKRNGKTEESHGKPMANEWQTDAPDPTRPDPLATNVAREGTPQAAATPKKTRGHRIPDKWHPSNDLVQNMITECPNVDQATEHRVFMDYWKAAAGAKGVKVDWEATYRNWIRRAAKNTPQQRMTASDRRLQQGAEITKRAAARKLPADPFDSKELTP